MCVFSSVLLTESEDKAIFIKPTFPVSSQHPFRVCGSLKEVVTMSGLPEFNSVTIGAVINMSAKHPVDKLL